MNVQITWNGADITTSVTEYVREQDICTGQGTLDLTVEAKTARNFIPWNTLIVYENGNKMGTYNIFSAEEQVPGGIYVVSCQDDSKRLTDHFIDQLYTIDYPSTAKYWIEKFLTEAGVSYNFNTAGYGNSLSEDTQLGGISAYDEFIYLLQLCGWYFYFDADNVCQIGNLDAVATPVETFTDNQIIKIGYTKNDKMLRNRAVVWGAGDPDTHIWIYADTSTKTAWNRPGNDYRTVVYSNTAIKTWGIAYSLAAAILTEFSKTTPEKNLQVVSSYSNVVLGSFVRGITDTLTVDGMVTHLSVNMSSSGFTSTYILDKRCPRLFGYVNWSDYVYIGTTGDGVWRKWITQPTWYNYSTGITDLNIKDLSAYEGMLGLVTDGGQAYIRHNSQGAWSQYAPSSLIDYYTTSGQPTVISSGILAEASSLDRAYGVNGAITVGFTVPNPSGIIPSGAPSYWFPASGNLSWVQSVALGGVPVYSQQIIITSGLPPEEGTIYPNPYDIGIIDIETNWDGNNLIIVYNAIKKTPISQITGVPGSGYGGTAVGAAYQGVGQTYTSIGWDNDTTAYLPPTTSGIFSEINQMGSFIASGIPWSSVISTAFHGTFYLDENPEKNGTLYTFYNGYMAWINVINFVWDAEEEDAEERTYYFDTTPWTYDQKQDIVSFYKVDDTHFSALYFTSTLIQYKVFEIQDPEDWEIDDGVATVVSTTDMALNGLITSMPITSTVGNGIDDTQYIAIPAGKYYVSMYANGAYYDHILTVAVIDMTTGSLSYTEVGPSEYSIAIAYMNQSPNYVYMGAMHCPDITEENKMDYIWDVYTVLVNKNTGAVSISEEHPEIEAKYDGFFRAYANDRDLYTATNYQKRVSFVGVFNENPDTAVGFGKLFVSCDMWDWIAFNVVEYTSHIVVIDITTPGLTTTMHEYFDVRDTNYQYTSIESPLWLFGGSIPEGFYPTFSRNISPTPIFFRGMRASIYTDTYYENILVSPDFSSMYELATYPGLSLNNWDIVGVGSLMDDEDNSIYITRGTSSDVLVGYNLDGSIKKIEFAQTYLSGGKTYWGGNIAGPNVLQNKAFLSTASSSEETVYVTYFYNPTASGYIETPRYLLLFNNPTITSSGSFNEILEMGGPYYVDTSKNVPTVIYAKPYVDDNPSAYMGRSFTNEYGSFTLISPGGGMGTHDVRTFDLYDEFGVFPASGVASGILDRYIGVAGGHLGAVMFNSGLTNNGGMFVPYTTIASGNFTHLDFTNNDPDPYIFVSTSGISTSGRFFQRDKESILWNDYSSTLPSGVITIIRADDRM